MAKRVIYYRTGESTSREYARAGSWLVLWLLLASPVGCALLIALTGGT